MDEQISVSPVSKTNPLLARVRIPGETFTLPSGGVFYTNGELTEKSSSTGEVHVYPMTSIDELVMKSVDKVFSGEAVKEVFARCIPDILQPGKLSAKDVDYLLVALRKVSYGPTFEMTYTHTCENAGIQTYDVPLDTFIRGVSRLNPTMVDRMFEFVVPNGQVVKFKPASYDDVIMLYQAQHSELFEDDIDDMEQLRRIFVGLVSLIDTVDGISDKAMIMEWMKELPILVLKDLSDAAKNTTDWGIVFEVEIECKDCGHKVKVPTPLNPISFFI